jgi:S-DNA-T family DNA segregation ATPase FtsK/SpoIIIE
MAKKANKATNPDKSSFQISANLRIAVGYLVLMIAGLLAVSILSYFVFWQTDYAQLEQGFWESWRNPDFRIRNLGGKLGGVWAHQLVYLGYGLAAILWPWYLGKLGYKLVLNQSLKPMWRLTGRMLFLLLWLPALLAYILPESLALLYGIRGLYIDQWLQELLGTVGAFFLLLASMLIFVLYVFGITPVKIQTWWTERKAALSRKREEAKAVKQESSSAVISPVSQETEAENEPMLAEKVVESQSEEPASKEEQPSLELEVESEKEEEDGFEAPPVVQNNDQEEDDEDVLEVEVAKEEKTLKESNQKVKDFGEYDPTLDLSRFQLPPIDLLNQYGGGNITIDSEELENNKRKIVETLADYKIEIAKIKATIGPTVTLYEIVPAAGVRISKIKNLEDDIALSLAALGIRIIAPIPGKGTIGIEVPNQNPQMVSMRNLLLSEKYQNTNFELPIAFGKTISNETLIADLAKMPHLLMAGATGQGKSVGLNVILTSILYKKHPSQVKFVLVDPKKVELTLFNKIERHYLAKLPNNEEAIITDTKKVIYTLNSLCIEMDERYDLLKNAMVRNIKEYNAKFIQRRLNPEEGHRFLPYIVLVIDEFADLIMTAGKEVETPIARLAQLARAIGIHLIVATQRPSVNVITGMIKANFPARIAFRVTAKVDSRTILDSGGAEQLIGKGDMLYSTGSDLIRIQCAFVDTPEVEAITDFIGNQQGYPDAYLLPEYEGEEGGESADVDLSDRDAMFEEAARIIVQHQQGSASLLQRKLRLGYNRAGRLIDQLEAAGIIGPFEGSKARQVNIKDEASLEQLLKNINL